VNTELPLNVKQSLVSDQPRRCPVHLVTEQAAQCFSNGNNLASLGITSENGPDGSIDAAEIERIARKKILLEG
jgi:hypothetical protein